MNSLKNLVIIAVLAAVGYGIYVSLVRNNADPGPPLGMAEGWPTVPKVEMPSAKVPLTPGGPLALGSAAPRPAGGTAPPFAPPAASPSSPGAPPYPSSPASSSSAASSPVASLGTPIAPPAGMVGSAAGPVAGQAATPPADLLRNIAPPPDAQAAAAAAPKPASSTDTVLQAKFAAFMTEVQKKLEEDKLAEAHSALSMLYGNPDMPAEQARQITDLLDRLAGTVIYSRRHYLEPPYVTQSGETIDKIAQRYNVPWELLANINGLMPVGGPVNDAAVRDKPIPAGTELKVVRGPFEAVVRLDRHELTLLLQGRYAGRFPVAVGRDQPRLEGTYSIGEKALGPTYYGPDGVTISAGDPKNPLGRAWIGLTDRIGIHGISDPQCVGRSDNRGTIGVADRDLQDLYGILSVGSKVTVLR